MKIFKDGVELLELPDKPKNFDGGCKGGTLFITHGDEKVTLATYGSFAEASTVNRALWTAYRNDAISFDLPPDAKK